jgi:hypothetical protein
MKTLLRIFCLFTRSGGHDWDGIRYTQNLYQDGKLVSSQNYFKCKRCEHSTLKAKA